jgi:hypothetical protein
MSIVMPKGVQAEREIERRKVHWTLGAKREFLLAAVSCLDHTAPDNWRSSSIRF